MQIFLILLYATLLAVNAISIIKFIFRKEYFYATLTFALIVYICYLIGKV